MFWVCLLLFALLSGENPSPIAHFESGLPCITGGYVNVVTGAPCLSADDLVIPGVEPLSLGRTYHYDPVQMRTVYQPSAQTWDLDFVQAVSLTSDGVGNKYYSHTLDSQPMFSFTRLKGEKAKMFFFDVVKDAKGSTNLGHGYPSGRFALKNIYIYPNEPTETTWSAVVLSGNGERKKFWGTKEKHSDDAYAPLQEIETPNRFKKRFHWGIGYEAFKIRTFEVHGIDLFSPSDHQIVNVEIQHRREGDYHKVEAKANGQHLALTYSTKTRDRKHQLMAVDSSDRPRIEYGYLRGEHNRRLETISLPDSRGVKFSYWAEGDSWIDKEGRHGNLSKYAQLLHKVKTIEQPVSASPERIATHLIQYFQDDRKNPEWHQAQTRVISTYGHVDDYFYDRNFVLQEVAHFTNLIESKRLDFLRPPLQLVCDLKEKFYWNEGGQIREKVQLDGVDHPLRSVSYEYDGRGNILKETFKGNLTGQNEEETAVKTATYSDDGFNLLLSETLSNGLQVQYGYKPNTNLLTRRSTVVSGETVREELFEYDDDNCLILSKEISAFVDRTEKIKPSRVVPFGYPLEKEIYAGDNLMETYSYRYNNRGDVVLEERRDASGQLLFSIERTFDPHGNCLTEKDSLGRIITRTFDANDNCTVEVGPRPGFVKLMKYDFMNRALEERICFDGQEWTTDHAYNLLNQRVSTTNYLQQEVKTAFDRYGRPIRITLPRVDAGSPVILKTYDPFGNEISTTDPLGRTTYKKYTAKDKPYEVIFSDGKKQTIVYSIEGHPLQVTDEDGVATDYTYDSLGRILSKTTPHGKELYHYRGLHLIEKVDMENVSTTYQYDLLGRLIETKRGNRVETIAYDRLGHPYRKSHFEGDLLLSVEVSKADPLGKTLESYLEDPSGAIYNHKKFCYDEAGNCVEEWNGDAKIERTFDGLNRVIYVKDSQNNEHRVIYSQVEREEVKTVVDPNGQQVITLYNALGKEKLIRQVDPFGQEIRRKEITYDLAGNVIKEETISPKDKRTLLKEVDERGRVVTLIEPLKKVTRMSYTGTGKLKVLTKPDGVQLTHTYIDGRLSRLQAGDLQLDYSYVYNRRGELIEVLDRLTGETSIQLFSPLGELLSETLPTGETMTYTYDGLGRMTSYSLPDGGQAKLTYNARAVTSVQRLNNEGAILYQHTYNQFDNLGNVIEEQLIGEAGTVSYTFDSLYQLESIHHPYYEQKNLLYDKVGNLLSYEKNGEPFTFCYDTLYQLTAERGHSYSYDPFHNRTAKDGDLYQVNELNQLLACSDTHYTYDLNGNLLQLENSTHKILFSYDPLNRLTSIDNGEETVTFTYDSFHRRLTRNGISFHFCREQEIGFENTLRILGPGLGADIGAAVAIELDTIPYAPLHDHQGSIIGLIALSGDLLSSWSYTAYGELVGTSLSPWGFSSKRQEPLTGWISFGRRDYDPSTGRWTTPDPLGFESGPNLYTYVFNRPLTHRDPLGLKPDDAESRIYTKEESWLENVRDVALDIVEFFSSFFEFGTAIEDRIFAYGGQDRTYEQEMYIYELCDLKNLLPDSVVTIYVNGIGVSSEEFQKNCSKLEEKGFNVVGIYNPYHGEGSVNFCRDFFRAYCGVRGHCSEKTIENFNHALDQIVSKAPQDTRFLLCPHSEGNILSATALESYQGDFSRFAYLGNAPAKYLGRDILSEYAFLMHSSDIVAHFDFFGRRNTDASRIHIVESSFFSFGMHHSFLDPTTFPHLVNGIENYAKNGKLSF